jgi:hypothetical protein
MPRRDDIASYRKRPNGADQRVYSMLEKEGYPDGWEVLSWSAIESDAINSLAKAKCNPPRLRRFFFSHAFKGTSHAENPGAALRE